ncbi:MAG TPA: M23 family metallopeptidase [Verrucomicrobiae bacterium]|jgi:murein DD-endopeptidase MepM/ murein hydrolase activator NlpD|nr:M23 family metallopeptidase [Verrucomicrobiae bacterium]
MKRSHCLLSAAVLLALGVVGLAVPTRDTAPPAPPALAEAPGVAPAAPEPVEVTLKRGETLEAALRRGGIERAETAAIVAGLRSSVNMRRLAPGERLTVTPGRPETSPRITWTRSPAERYEIRSTEGRWTVEAVRPDVDTRVVAIAGEVRDSLFASLERLGETAMLTARLVSLFEWDFDFAADSLPGDRFRFLVEKRYVGDELLGYGDILVAQYMTAGRPVLTSVAFREAGSRADYYDASGRSVRKMFLRAPLDFTRVTSGFSHARHHPILGGLRPHLAVDYGAPVGTPVRAVADGVVTQAGWDGGFGLSISLRHARGYETMYNHLSRLDVKRGERVRQRQVIGRVGTTGLSTGPHLDYRVRKAGVFVNPLGEKFIPGAPVPAHRREAFTVHVKALLERLDAQAPFPPRAPGRS